MTLMSESRSAYSPCLGEMLVANRVGVEDKGCQVAVAAGEAAWFWEAEAFAAFWHLLLCTGVFLWLTLLTSGAA